MKSRAPKSRTIKIGLGLLALCGSLIVFAFNIRAVSAASSAPAESAGLILTFQRPAGGSADAAASDARISRLISLYVPKGDAPTPFTSPGPFRATFEGEINVRLRSYVQFMALGQGKLILTIGGKKVLEVSGEDLSGTSSDQVRLNKGRNHIVAAYESPTAGDASLRLFWSSRSWQPEPVPPMVFTHSVSDPAIARGLLVREGRYLLADFRCLKCHASGESAAAGNHGAMPELASDAPSLADAGARLNADWLAAWINDPQSLRPSAHMPRLFPGRGIDPRAKDIAAYLVSLGKSPPDSAQGDADAGGRTFANLDCIACHTAPDGKDDPSRIPLKLVKAKFNRLALRDYLLNPNAHYLWNPMPNFHLSAGEADDVTAYLFSTATAGVKAGASGDATKGAALITRSGCLNCHSIGDTRSTARFPVLSAISKDALNKGCLAIDAASRGAAPEFALSDQQREALIAFLQTDRESLNRRSPPEFAERQISAMRCTACHARDGNESLLTQSLDVESQELHQKFPNPAPGPGDLLAADQRPPLLTWAGEKLRPEWMAKFIAGQVPYKPRYYLRARMPSFAARAGLLASGMAEEHGCPPFSENNSKRDPRQAEIGRKLCSKVPNQGFSCVQCHAVADSPPFAAFEAPAINFEYTSDRMRHDYYMRWMHDPLRVDPNTKMPRFDDADGKTSLPTFDGDAKKQFEAIWQYLLAGDNIKPPQ